MRLIAVRALQSNQDRLVVLAEAVREAGHGGLDELKRSNAMDVAHQLVGSAGTFGYSRVSQLARQLEHFFRDPDVDAAMVGAATEQIALMQQDLQGEPDD